MQRTFTTPDPISLYVELGAGDVDLDAGDVTQTTVTVDGRDADDVSVEQHGNQVSVVAPRQRLGFFGSGSELRIRVSMPAGSEVATKLGSADLVATGRLGTTRHRSGSGDLRVEEVDADAVVETGSGDATIGTVTGSLRVKSGSGEVEVRHAGRSTVVSTGSGNVEIDTAHGSVQVKSGSGDATVNEASTDLSLSTSSGDLSVGAFHRGSLLARNVSGDIHVGVPADIPVWTDISCVSGSVSSTLMGAGQPTEGQDYIEIRAKTVSGDIELEQL